jgi:hypothetical protein
MRKICLCVAAAASLLVAPAAYAQFVYLGHEYCWYSGGWKGPGFYRCGYAWRHGYGWGGPAGWMGYSYRGGAYYHGGAVYRGYYGGYHGGGVNAGAGYVSDPNGRYTQGTTVNGSNRSPTGSGIVTGPKGRNSSGAHTSRPGDQAGAVVPGH